MLPIREVWCPSPSERLQKQHLHGFLRRVHVVLPRLNKLGNIGIVPLHSLLQKRLELSCRQYMVRQHISELKICVQWQCASTLTVSSWPLSAIWQQIAHEYVCCRIEPIIFLQSAAPPLRSCHSSTWADTIKSAKASTKLKVWHTAWNVLQPRPEWMFW